jgi:hypothetical protein
MATQEVRAIFFHRSYRDPAVLQAAIARCVAAIDADDDDPDVRALGDVTYVYGRTRRRTKTRAT